MAGATGGRAADDGRWFEMWTDAELVDELRARARSDPLWTMVLDRCARSMISILHGMLLDDDRHGPALRHRYVRLSPAELAVLRDDDGRRRELVVEAVAQYLELFETRVRRADGWSADGTASLTTYVVNGGLFALADGIRAWRREVAEQRRYVPVDPDELRVADAVAPDEAPEPDVDVDDVRRLLGALADKDPLLVAALLRRVDTGDSWSDIAEHLSTTRKTLERRLARARRRLIDRTRAEAET